MKTPQPADRREAHHRRVRRRQARAGRPRAAGLRHWQARRTSCGRSAASSAEILLPGRPRRDCDEVDTGGYKVITTLDWKMQQIAENWVYAAARAPERQGPARRSCGSRKIPQPSDWDWILGLRGHNIHNAAAAVIDYRTGQVLAYVGSAELHVARATRSSSPSSTSCPTAGASRVRRSSRSTT